MEKYNIGDKVWYAGRENTRVYVKCPDCLGAGALTVRFADGQEVSIACVTCSTGYEPPTGRVFLYQYKCSVREVTICGIEIQRDKTEYKFEEYYCADGSNFFSTKEEAEVKAAELAEEATRKEVYKLHSKEKPTRTWAWNASYYRKMIKEAEADIVRWSARLAVAKIKPVLE